MDKFVELLRKCKINLGKSLGKPSKKFLKISNKLMEYWCIIVRLSTSSDNQVPGKNFYLVDWLRW